MFEVRSASKGDLTGIVKVHQSAFPRFFMTSLGPSFLRLYYAQVLRHSSGILLVGVAEGTIVGFIAGFVNPETFYKCMKQRRFQYAISLLPTIISRPRVIPRLLSNFGRVSGFRRASSQLEAELASLAVQPAAANKGIGKALVRAFVLAAKGQGADAVYLTTDAHDNDPVNRFYSKLGFGVTQTFQASFGRTMNEYVINI
jgi:ribosomal protein S18 acetylase RimI-like enzyme